MFFNVPAYTSCGSVPGMHIAGHRYLFSSFRVTGVICRALLGVHTHTARSYDPTLMFVRLNYFVSRNSHDLVIWLSSNMQG